MAAEDELAIPEVPEARPDDAEDVSWALSTAEAMWARGDHLEGIKWVRKAAEAASDVENDERALELAKAASELTTLIARRSRASMGDSPGLAGGAPPDFMTSATSSHGPQPPSQAAPSTSAPPMSGKPISVAPSTSRMGGAPALPPSAAIPREARGQSAPPPPPASAAPSAPAAPSAAGASKPPAVGRSAAPAPMRSVPPGPIPLPSRASAAPKAPLASPTGRAAPRPLATNDARQGPQPGKGVLSNRVASEPPKGAKVRRRSRDNLEAEARAAAALVDTAPVAAVDGATAETAIANEMADAGDGAVEVPVADARVKRRSRPEPDLGQAVHCEVVGRVDELVEATRHERERSAEEWDASPTQNLTGDDMDHMNHGDHGDIAEGDRKTTAFAIPISVQLPASAPAPTPRPPMPTVHDPGIQVSQAVRVVVWRDGTGVHVAPAGTVVSSITIDAVLVVLEPSADLTAWLSQRER